MTAVPMLQALSWGEESPLRPSGEVDVEALAHGLARSDYPGGRRRQPYTRAQHAVVVSEAVEMFAGLRLPERRVLAMHAWLAEVRDAELRDKKCKRAGEARKRLALRTIDLEALADVLAHTNRWDDSVAPAAAAFDESLKSLGGLDSENRRRLSLYALLAETVLAGLGTAVAEAALKAAGLRPGSTRVMGTHPAVRPPDGGRGSAPRPAGPGLRRGECLSGHQETHRVVGAGQGRAALACALPGADHSQGESKDMNDSEQVRTLRWPGAPATVTAAEMDFEAVAHVLGNTCCWGGRSRRFYSLAQHALTVSGAIDRLGGMNEEDRRVLSLHALLADAWRAWVREDPGAQPSGKAAAQARRSEKAAVIRTVLEAARLDIELPGDWADALRFTQRMAEAAVSRDLPEGGTGGERSGPLGGTGPLFPPLKDRTRPLRPDRAATLWFERFGELSKPAQGDTEQ